MSLAQGIQIIKQYADTLSTKAGVYRMIDAHNQVLYVGKAKHLKHRILSYTNPDKQSLRIQRMMSRTRRMEFVETASEAEALLLEADLIKSLKPYYNIVLRDDKSYPEIELSFCDGVATLKKHRGIHRKGCQYFGPFSNTRAVNKTLDILKNVFYLAHADTTKMSKNTVQHRKRYNSIYRHQFMRNFAPDVPVDADGFDTYVDEVIQFLKGKDTQLLSRLETKMQEASHNNNFETAIMYRDRIRALHDLHISQGTTLQGVGDCDVFAVCRSRIDSTHHIICVQILFYRQSATAGSAVFFPRVDTAMNDADILMEFMYQYYGNDNIPAKKVFLSHDIGDKNQHTFMDIYPSKIHTPKSGMGKRLTTMALKNAQSALDRHQSHISKHLQALQQLTTVLELDDIPQRIEVYDNSHHQGDTPVGAMIVVNAEGFEKKSYRSWDIKTQMMRRDDSGYAGDDYAMMNEVITRRFTRAIKDQSVLPDLVVVDGGKGQLSTVKNVMDKVGVSHIPIVCIAKGDNRNDGTETFYTCDVTIPISIGSDLHFFMERIRDESHRFAIGTHRKKRRKKMLSSPLDAIDGIGKNRRTKLLQYFGSSVSISGAGVDDLMRVEGISRALAEKIYNHFHKT